MDRRSEEWGGRIICFFSSLNSQNCFPNNVYLGVISDSKYSEFISLWAYLNCIKEGKWDKFSLWKSLANTVNLCSNLKTTSNMWCFLFPKTHAEGGHICHEVYFSSHSGYSSLGKMSLLRPRKVFTSSRHVGKSFSTSPLDSHRTLICSRSSEYEHRISSSKQCNWWWFKTFAIILLTNRMMTFITSCCINSSHRHQVGGVCFFGP